MADVLADRPVQLDSKPRNPGSVAPALEENGIACMNTKHKYDPTDIAKVTGSMSSY